MRDLLASTAFQIANSEIRQVNPAVSTPNKRSLKPVLFRQVTGRSAGQAAMEVVFRNFSDYVEKKEKDALEVEFQRVLCFVFGCVVMVALFQVQLHERTEEAMVLRDKSVETLCSNLALRYIRMHDRVAI
jgi:hypothetical protein